MKKYLRNNKKTLTFKEAARFLKTYIDLEKEKQKTLKEYKGWKLIKALVKANLIKNEEDLNRQFANIKFKENELKALLKKFKKGERITAVFVPPTDQKKFNLGNLYDLLFKKDNSGLWKSKLYIKTLGCSFDKIHSINLKRLGDLKKFLSLGAEKQRIKLQKIYNHSPDLPPSPQIYFTINNINGDRIFPCQSKLSAQKAKKLLKKKYLTLGEALDISDKILRPNDKFLIKILTRDLQKDITYINPLADLVFKRKLLDSKKGVLPASIQSVRTIYFNSILPSGEFLNSFWDSGPENHAVLEFGKSGLNQYFYRDFKKVAARTLLMN